MKNNAYVIIDAHIIRCRLHHHNTLKYSVGLKSGTCRYTQEKMFPLQPNIALPINWSSKWIRIWGFMQINTHMITSRRYSGGDKADTDRTSIGRRRRKKTCRINICQFSEGRFADLPGIWVLMQRQGFLGRD